ncbi:MAG TPA: hypothetical protein VHX19_21015 [Stellaceae bacterium]|jgi:hypothetical protein|nr:hypothetical protein [Stellaceae bacterium]
MAETSVDERAFGLADLDRNDAAGAVSHFWAALASGAAAADVPHYLGLSLCLSGDDGGFLRLAEACQGGPDVQLDFYQTILLDTMKHEAWDALLRHAGNVPPATRFHAVATYYAGCAELTRGRHDRALQHFSSFRRDVLSRHKEFPLLTNSKINLIFRQACLLETPEAIAELMTLPEANFARGRPRLHRPGNGAGAAEHVFLCCCDVAYFKRFAAELCRSMQRWRPDALLHFHVANLDDETAATAAELANSHALAVNVSGETAPVWSHNVYYACNRFLVAPTIMDWYQKPLLILDADSLILGDLHEITDALPGYDFACFETGRTEPASMFQATITHFANNERARHLLEILARLMIPKLDMPWSLSWMLDQAALYSAIRYAERFAPEIRVGDLKAITGRDLRSFIGGLGCEEEKWQMMVTAHTVGAPTQSLNGENPGPTNLAFARRRSFARV